MMQRVLAAGAVIASVLALAACGSSSSSTNTSADSSATAGGAGTTASATTTGGSSTTAGTTTPAEGSCGSIPKELPSDPDGVLAKLPAEVQAGYNLYPQAVKASAWANWKPKHDPPYTLYYAPSLMNALFPQEILTKLKELTKSGIINKIVVQDAGGSVQTQIQQMNQAIRDKADIILSLPLSAAALAPSIEAAGKAGIPVITPLGPASNQYAVAFDGNNPAVGAALASGLAQSLGGKGDYLQVHGIPGVDSDTQMFAGADKVFANCPDMKKAGSVTGQFNPSTAKTAILQFLSSHPQPVQATVLAFQQTGRPVPAIGDVGGTPALLSYEQQHPDYYGISVALPSNGIAEASYNIAVGLLQGRGLKIADLSQAPVTITPEDASKWAKSDVPMGSPLTSSQIPEGIDFYAPSLLDSFFVKPAPSS
jgi:ribose transport system substrate-binding protein